MTITNKQELLSPARTEEDRNLLRIAGALANKYGETAPQKVREHMFGFAASILTAATKLRTESPDSNDTDEQQNSDRPQFSGQPLPLVELTQADEDVQADEAGQALLASISTECVSQVVQYARNGIEFANEVSSYALQVGGMALEIVRIKPRDIEQPITYTLSEIHTAAED
jgi:hypothetical protein